MNNRAIIILLVAVIGLGSWIVYDRTKSNNNTPSLATNSSQASNITNKNTLDLSGKGLTVVGPDVYNQAGVTELILSNNQLKTLPSEMGRMTSLQILKLDHNQLEGSLIAEIRMMPLRVLDVSYNRMTGMPAEIGQLNNLQTLDYSYNGVTDLPNELANLKNNLKELNLKGNPISQDKISKLKASLPNTRIIF